MADNKQTLNPELKQIYERVMNTPVKPPTSLKQDVPQTQSQEQPQTSNPAPVQAVQNQTPPPPQITPQPTINNQTTTPMQATASITTPNKTGQQTTPQIAPKPLKGNGNSFVFVSGNQNANTQQATKPAQNKSKMIFVVLGIIFFSAYTVFWLFFFGILKTSTFGL